MKSITRKKLTGEKAPNYKGGVCETVIVCKGCDKGFIAHRKRQYCSKTCGYKSKERGIKISKTRIENGNAYKTDMERFIGKKLGEYKGSAKRRNLVFSLSKDAFSKLVLSDCEYCGDELSFGVDRLDPAIGYTAKNAVACCSKCNFAKHTMTIEEFKSHILKIYKKITNQLL